MQRKAGKLVASFDTQTVSDPVPTRHVGRLSSWPPTRLVPRGDPPGHPRSLPGLEQSRESRGSLRIHSLPECPRCLAPADPGHKVGAPPPTEPQEAGPAWPQGRGRGSRPLFCQDSWSQGWKMKKQKGFHRQLRGPLCSPAAGV